MKPIIERAAWAVLLIALISTTNTAMAQPVYPNKPVTMVVGYPAGSGLDITTRILNKKLGDIFHQSFLVNNKPGAASNLAAEVVVRAPKDGYTLLMGSSTNPANTTLFTSLSFNFSEDLSPITIVATVPNVLVVNPSLPVYGVQDLIALAKRTPGQIFFGSPGNGTTGHLTGEMLNLTAGIKLVHLPYKGFPVAITDLLAGRINVLFNSVPPVLPYIKDGKLRALATTGRERAGILPDLPTISEAGLRGFEAQTWFGLLAPRGTPDEIVDRLYAGVREALSSADVREQFAKLGLDPVFLPPREFSAFIRTETEKWAKVIRASGAKID